jgi:hypothetical protein
MIGGGVIYYFYYNKQINKRILEHIKGHPLMSPLKMTIIIIIIGLLFSGVCTYHYNSSYYEIYQKLIINGVSEFEEKKMSQKILLKYYQKQMIKTKYETCIYYTKKGTDHSEDGPNAYFLFRPVKKAACVRIQCAVKEFKFDRPKLPFVNTNENNTAICFTTALRGTTVHIVIEQYYWSTKVINAYKTKSGDLDLPFNDKTLDKRAFGIDHFTISVRV